MLVTTPGPSSSPKPGIQYLILMYNFYCVLLQDSRGRGSDEINRLGSYSEASNQARNFWHFIKLPLDRDACRPRIRQGYPNNFSTINWLSCRSWPGLFNFGGWPSIIMRIQLQKWYGLLTAPKYWSHGVKYKQRRKSHVFGRVGKVMNSDHVDSLKEVRYVNVRLKGLKEGTFRYADVPMLDPQDVLNYLHFHVGLQCPMDGVKRYWDSLRENGLLATEVTDQHIPVSLYGDEVQVNKQGDSIFGLYVSLTLFKPRKVRVMHYCIFSLRSHLVDGIHTLWPVLRRVTASLNAAFDQPGGIKFAVAEFKGDWPFLRKIFRFVPSYTGNRTLHVGLAFFRNVRVLED